MPLKQFLFAAIKRLQFLWKVESPNSTTPPYIFNIYEQVIITSRGKSIKAIEQVRESLLQSKTKVNFESLGATSRVLKHTDQQVSKIAQSSLSSPEDAYLIGILGRHLKSKVILELGTSLGISTGYLKTLNPDSNIISMEGNHELLNIAKENNADSIHFIQGNINETLPQTLKTMDHVDLVIMDANHTKEATLQYFNQIKSKCHNNSCVVLDDIYWSQGMDEAWSAIKSDPIVSDSIDLYDLGILLFRNAPQNRHFSFFK